MAGSPKARKHSVHPPSHPPSSPADARALHKAKNLRTSCSPDKLGTKNLKTKKSKTNQRSSAVECTRRLSVQFGAGGSCDSQTDSQTPWVDDTMVQLTSKRSAAEMDEDDLNHTPIKRASSMANTPTIQNSSATLLAADVGISPPSTQPGHCDGNSAVDTTTSHAGSASVKPQTHRLVCLVTPYPTKPFPRLAAKGARDNGKLLIVDGVSTAAGDEDSSGSLSEASDTAETEHSRARMRGCWLDFVSVSQEHTAHYYAKYKDTKHCLRKVSKAHDVLEAEVHRLHSELVVSQETLAELQQGFTLFASKFANIK